MDSVESAKNAEAGGATRLELCQALSEGGLTPSPGLLQVVKSVVKIPVFAMIRPRRGMDFCYSDHEVKIMEYDILSLKTVGADGFVFGALTFSRNVDVSTCQKLVNIASPLTCTFHRAFDVLKEHTSSLETIISLGFTRLLTSGQQETAEKGVKLIKQLIFEANNRIVIMPGAGITESNLEIILTETGAKEFHASARSKVTMISEDPSDEKVSMGAADGDFSLMVTNKQIVERMVKTSKLIWNS